MSINNVEKQTDNFIKINYFWKNETTNIKINYIQDNKYMKILQLIDLTSLSLSSDTFVYFHIIMPSHRLF